MELLENTVQPYAWGSRTAIANLMGRAPGTSPEAELWMGAHPSAPSKIGGESLAARITAAPASILGGAVQQRFGTRLPFLLKILAADAPLSLQAHPTMEQAREGYDREEKAGVPLTAAHRNYKDRSHKPELICALGRFEALCGFRHASESRALFEALGMKDVSSRITDARAAFQWLMALSKDERARIVASTVEGARRVKDGPFAGACAWAVKLSSAYPGDIGVTVSLLLNHMVLDEGEAIWLPAGNMHAYLQGVGVEIMANSDNVLRGGLTPKHVDVPELMRVLDFKEGPVPRVLPTSSALREGTEDIWSTPAGEFRLSRIRVQGRAAWDVTGPEIVWCHTGALRSGNAELTRGKSAFIPASEGRVTLEGEGTIFRAAVPV